MIAAAKNYIRFVHFHFGSDYKRYIETKGVETQKELIQDGSLDTCVHMQCTKWFDLTLVEGRRGALCHVLALLRWHDAQGSN
jgi:hypothetical protein